jgi:tetratricopeptide (TPR) repeat protein
MADASSTNSQSRLPPSVVAAEQRAREFLSQSKWRKAREEAKPLVKLDRARYLPLLIEANMGLAREMTAKGQVAEARQVLEYLATIVPREQLVGLEVNIAGQSDDRKDFLGKFATALITPPGNQPEAERVRLADQVVLAFAPLPAGHPAEATLGPQLRGIHEALQAVAQQQWDRVPEWLRGIPRRSPFSHWAVFIKGLAAFHTGDAERAARFFGSLPAESVPAKASQAYRLVAGSSELPKNQPRLAEGILRGACHLVGQAGVAALLLRAEQFWQEGRYKDSYRVLRDSVAQFPSDGADWLGSVSEFYFQAPYGMSLEQRDKCLGFFSDLVDRNAVKNRIEELRILRLLALSEPPDTGGWGLRSHWEGFLRIHEQVRKSTPRFKSLAYGWLGEQLAQSRGPSYYGMGSGGDRMWDAEGACDCLEKARQLDPQNLQAHLQLSKVYEALNRKSERNRLLDEMAEQFPEEKQVLLENARGCIERKAFTKALELLERARQLDQLDPTALAAVVTTRRQLARQQFQRGRLEKARQVLEPLTELLTDRADDLHRSRWTAWLRQGLLERLHGDAAQGQALLDRARAASPHAAGFLLFAHLTHRVYTAQPVSPFLAELKAELAQEPSATQGLLLLHIYHYWEKAPDKQPWGFEAGLLRKYLKAAAKKPCTRAEAKEIVELCGPEEFGDPARAFTNAMLRRDPGDPLFRLLKRMLRPPWTYEPEDNRRQLKAILEEAQRRGEQDLIPKLQGLIRSLDNPPPMPMPMPMPPDDPDFDAAEDWEGTPGFEDGLPDFRPGDFPGFAELMAGLANASEAEIRELKRTRPKDIPEFMFDKLLDAARKGMSPKPPSPPPKPLPKPPRPLPPAPRRPPMGDPNQGTLF